MRCLLFASCLIVLASGAPKDDFVNKLLTTINFWPASNLGKITDSIVNDVCSGKSMQDIADKLLNYLQSNTPMAKVPTLLGMMTTCNKCLDGKKTGTKTPDIMKKAFPVFQNLLQDPYNAIKTKCDTMTANGKSAADKMTQGYTIASTKVTDALIQKLITNSSGKMTLNEWTCAIDVLPQLLNLKKFNTARP